MNFRVKVTHKPRETLAVFRDWLLSQRAGETGFRWFAAWLAEFPERCALAPENRMFPFEVRHLLYGHKPNVYRILLTIDRATVCVLHIRHGRRQPARH